MKQETTRINCDLPEYVHDFLKSLHGTKKANAEMILIEAAKAAGYNSWRKKYVDDKNQGALLTALKGVCKDNNIETDAGLHDRLKGTPAYLDFNIIRNLWGGEGLLVHYELVMRELGVKKLKCLKVKQ